MANARIDDDAYVAIDPAPGRPPIAAGAGARSADAWLRAVAAVSAFALAADASAIPAFALTIAGAFACLNVAPRVSTLAIAAIGAPIAASSAGAAAAWLLVAVCAARLRLQLGAAGAWLRDVWGLEWRRARALVATGLARTRTDPTAITTAGDHLEREGVARSRLEAIGATPSRALGWLLPASVRVGAWLRGLPRVHDALERWAAGASDRQI